MTHYQLGLACLVVLSMMGWAAAQDPPAAEASVYPLKIGTRWVYRVTANDEELDKKTSYQQTDTIVGVFDFRSGRFSCKASASPEATYNLWLRNAELGVEDVGVAWDEGLERPIAPVRPSLFIKYPAKLNETYISMASPEGVAEERATVVSIDTEVKVPAGTYRCLEYRFEEIDSKKKLMTLFVSPGVGIVKEEAYDYENGKLVQVMELLRFKNSEDD